LRLSVRFGRARSSFGFAERPQEGTPEFDADMQRWGELNQETKDAGVYVLATGLQYPDTATTLRAPGGDRVLTDGPYAETKEVLFSFSILDVEDLDAAIEWAAKTPVAEYGAVEIRATVGYEAA
jgi:hypothetical protein